MINIKLIVGENIRAFRQAKGWSQEKLAFEANLHRTYIGDIERGERNVSVVNVQKIAEALGVRAADLLRVEQASPSEQPSQEHR